MPSFASLGLSPSTLNALAAMGFEDPTPIQEQGIPAMLQGRDLIGQARTGTGKTAAFGLPIVEQNLRTRGHGVVALVLVPTRELAAQVTEQLTLLARGSDLRVIPVFGGVGFQPQVQALRGQAPAVLVATPGRLLDLLNQGHARLGGVRTLVLDEADRMLDMGFLPDVERILKALPRERQTALFSATLPGPIKKLSERFLRDPVQIRVESGPAATPLAEQFRIDLGQAEKPRALVALLAKEKPDRAIVFTRTKHLARRLARNLQHGGWEAVALQGNMTQGQRERALAAFRDGAARVLVATDIASRGLDIPEVSHIVNYDIPHEPDAYVHRVGRTARMGRTGRAFTFVLRDQATELRDVERAAGLQLQRYELGPLPEQAPEGPGRPQQPFHAPFSQRRAPQAPRVRPSHERRDGGQGPRRTHRSHRGQGPGQGRGQAPRAQPHGGPGANSRDRRRERRGSGEPSQGGEGRGWW